MDKRLPTLPNLRLTKSEKKLRFESPDVAKFTRQSNNHMMDKNYYSRPQTNKPTLSSANKAIYSESKSRNLVLIKPPNINIRTNTNSEQNCLYTDRCVTESDINNIIKACTKNKKNIEKKFVKKKKVFKTDKDPFFNKNELSKLKQQLSVGLLLICPPKSNTEKINFITTNRDHFMVKYDHLCKITPDLSLKNKDFLLKRYGIKKVKETIKPEYEPYYAKVYKFKMHEK
jgi:hypothetical protein